MVTSGTGLVAEPARPAGGAGALPRQRVAAEGGGDTRGQVRAGRSGRSYRRPRLPERALRPAGAGALTQESVEAGGAEAVLTAGPLEAVVAQTRPVDVVTLGPVLAVAFVGALRPVGAHGALVLAPAAKTAEEEDEAAR